MGRSPDNVDAVAVACVVGVSLNLLFTSFISVAQTPLPDASGAAGVFFPQMGPIPFDIFISAGDVLRPRRRRGTISVAALNTFNRKLASNGVVSRAFVMWAAGDGKRCTNYLVMTSRVSARSTHTQYRR